jgi:hypothetical protein
MAAPATWTELKDELLADCMREGDEGLIARLPYFIGRAEALFQRELFSPEREARATLVVASRVAALPADFGGVKLVWVEAPEVRVLDRLTAGALRSRYPSVQEGSPSHFAIEGEAMMFGLVPAEGAAVELNYIGGIPGLGANQPSNWLLADHPDVYIQAALAELYEFTEHYEKADRCRRRREDFIGRINQASRRRSIDSGPLAALSPVRRCGRWTRE